MRRRLILLLALLLSAFFTACRMEDYYPSKVSEYFPKPEGSPAEDPGIPVISADTTVPRDSIRSDTTAVDTLKPVVPVDTLKPVAPVDTLKPVVPVDTLKPVVSVDTLKPVVPADT
ncbi:MAG TPA: hypothetical protein VK465_09810, partial [Fibrobacteria bacterium]|nr:hypothetical protein [Fibrobacteria bacterium]